MKRIILHENRMCVLDETRYKLKEGLSSIIYHFTAVPTIYDILKNGNIELTISTNTADAYHKKNLFYLSTQRTKSSHMGYAGNSSLHGKRSIARIELDGDLLKQDGYQGKPLDYWGANMGKQSDIGLHSKRITAQKGETWQPNTQEDNENILKSQQTASNFEFEDRIFSKKPYLPLKYVKRIDVVLNGETSTSKDKAILELANANNIIVAYYQSEKDFIRQNNNTINNLIWKNHGGYTEETNNSSVLGDRINKDIVSTLSAALFYYKSFNNKANGNEQLTYDELAKVLSKFGLGKYYEYCKVDFKKKITYIDQEIYGIENTLRKLNTNSRYKTEMSHDVLEYAQYVMNHYGVNSCSGLRNYFKTNPLQAEKPQNQPIQESVKCVEISYYEGDEPTIKRGDNVSFWEIVDKNYFFQQISRKLDEDDWNEKCGEDVPRYIYHNSKSSESFLKYLQHLMHNDNLSMYDGTVILNKIFLNNKKSMYEILDIYLKPIQITKELYKRFESRISWKDREFIRQSLFGSEENYWNYVRENI